MTHFSKHLPHISTAIAVILCTFALVSCNRNSYENAIPSDASIVIKADAAKIYELLGLNKNINIEALKEDTFEDFEDDERARDKVLNILDNPDKSGIDFLKPIYVSVSFSGKEPTVLAIARVKNIKDLKETIKLLFVDISLDKKGGIYEGRSGESSYAFNDDAFIIGIDMDDSRYLANLLKDKQPKNKANGIKEIIDTKSGLAAWADMEVLNNTIEYGMSKKERREYREIFGDIDLEGAYMIANFKEDGNELRLDIETKGNENLQKNYSEYIGEINPEIIRNIPSNCFAFAGFNFNLDKIDRESREEINEDLSKYGLTLRDFSGEFGMGISDYDEYTDIPTFTLVTKASEKIKDLINENGKDTEFGNISSTSENGYIIVHNGRRGPTGNTLAENASGKCLSIGVDLTSRKCRNILDKIANSYKGREILEIIDIDKLGRISLSVDSDMKIRLAIAAKDSDQKVLKIIGNSIAE